MQHSAQVGGIMRFLPSLGSSTDVIILEYIIWDLNPFEEVGHWGHTWILVLSLSPSLQIMVGKRTWKKEIPSSPLYSRLAFTTLLLLLLTPLLNHLFQSSK